LRLKQEGCCCCFGWAVCALWACYMAIFAPCSNPANTTKLQYGLCCFFFLLLASCFSFSYFLLPTRTLHCTSYSHHGLSASAGCYLPAARLQAAGCQAARLRLPAAAASLFQAARVESLGQGQGSLLGLAAVPAPALKSQVASRKSQVASRKLQVASRKSQSQVASRSCSLQLTVAACSRNRNRNRNRSRSQLSHARTCTAHVLHTFRQQTADSSTCPFAFSACCIFMLVVDVEVHCS
jgi:hypothetical protein